MTFPQTFARRAEKSVPARASTRSGLADVDVLDVIARGLGRDAELPGDLLGRLPPGDQAQHLDLARREAGRLPGKPARAMPGGAEDRLDRLTVEATGADLAAQLERRPLRRVRGAVRPRLAHRLVSGGGGEDARGDRNRGAAQPARVTRAVHPLAVLRRQRPQRGERRRLLQHPLREVRDHANPLLPSHLPTPSAPRLSQIALETPSRPKWCTSPARRKACTSPAGNPSPAAAPAASSATFAECGLGIDHGRPGPHRVEPVEQLRAARAEELRERGIELRPPQPPAERRRRRDPAHP